MTSKELNLKLITAIPEIEDAYYQETSWQDGDETGSHIVYADVFVPYIKEQILAQNESILARVFDYIENLLTMDDEYANEVVVLSVLESLLFDDDISANSFMRFAKEKSLHFINEIVQGLGENTIS